jgi:Trk K+ transport system NAD-binding subunit
MWSKMWRPLLLILLMIFIGIIGFHIIVVAVKKPGEDIVFNPSPNIKLEIGDILLVLGDEKEVNQFESSYLGGQS